MADGPPETHRAGVVAILGPPNAGKSTLLNHLLGEKLAIVTAKPQTTRSRILGILSRPNAQLLLFDTPGLHRSPKALNERLNEQVTEALSDCDVAILLVDLRTGWGETHDELWQALAAANTPVFVAGTKSDIARSEAAVCPDAVAARAKGVYRIAAPSGRGVDRLIEAVAAALPEGPSLYPDDELTDRPLRWLVAELVREAFYEELGQELPYEMAAEVVKFDESRPDLVSIGVNLLVQRDSQKRIVIGRGGEMIKRIGVRARPPIEELVGKRVHLALWVKIEARWQKKKKRVEALGYS